MSVKENKKLRNVGVVIYRKGKETGTLEALWANTDQDHGHICKGVAVGGAGTAFEGNYSITYFNEQKQPAGPFELEIKAHGNVFHLFWRDNGKLMNHGIGILHKGDIIAGWAPI